VKRVVLGKPFERMGRKVNGPKAKAKAAGLPNRKVILCEPYSFKGKERIGFFY